MEFEDPDTAGHVGDVRSADRIYVLKRGRITETGHHDELMMADGVYAGLFRTQAAAHLDDLRSRA